MPDKIKSTAELNAWRKEYKTFINTMAALWLPFVIVASLYAFVLPGSIPVGKLPSLLRPIWNPVAIILCLGALYLLLIRFSPYGRNYTSNKQPFISAVLSFDQAQKQYNQWRRHSNRRDLLKAFKLARAAEPIMGDLSEFQNLMGCISIDCRANGLDPTSETQGT